MESKDWKTMLGEAFNINPDEVTNTPTNDTQELRSALDEQGKKMIDIILDKKGRNGKKATIIANLDLCDDNLKELAAELKRVCSVGGSARGGEILIQGDMREKVLNYLKDKGFKARII
ncbi:MAG: translation initiation factor [Muribaculaceae bacterium]|nr:translation initiation factor [Muribaculaceae bacterium]